MTKLLTASWMTLPVSVVVYLAATMLFWKPPAPAHFSATQAGHRPGQSGVPWEFSNPEADQLIAELKAEKKSLEKKEQQLNELATRLDAERTELNLVTQTVHQLQADFDRNVVHVQQEETVNLKKLAKVYSNMTPDAAAGIFGEMDDTSIARIMVFIKEPETAAILEALAKKGAAESKRAASLSERLRLSTVSSTTPK